MDDLDLNPTVTVDDTNSCTTLHGILPSRKGHEALALVTPWSPSTHSSASLTAAATLLAHLATAPWRAKDLVWVVPNTSAPCELLPTMRTWVRRYMDSDSACARGGALQQAVVVEVPMMHAETAVIVHDL